MFNTKTTKKTVISSSSVSSSLDEAMNEVFDQMSNVFSEVDKTVAKMSEVVDKTMDSVCSKVESISKENSEGSCSIDYDDGVIRIKADKCTKIIVNGVKVYENLDD